MKHPNAGKPWTELERTNLRERFLSGASLDELVQMHGRTGNAIVSELFHRDLLVIRGKAYYAVRPVPFVTFAEIKELS